MVSSIAYIIGFTLVVPTIISFEIGRPKRCRKIVGGISSKVNEFPWHVGITSSHGEPFCGGSLINNRYVLTAAHCVDNLDPWQVYVLLGVYDWTKLNPTDLLISASELIVHPNYDDEEFFNDIALIKMEKDIIFDENMKPACMPRPYQNYDGQMATVSGWGRTEEDGDTKSQKLLKVELPILSLNICRNAFGAYSVHSSALCAGWTDGKKDACAGDSGGPLVWQNDERWYLIGLVSWGYGCARPNYPAIYTRTDYYYDWIDSLTIGSKFCTT